MNNSPPNKNRRVLVIDDNQAIHDDFRKILSPAPATAAALDATEAALFGHSTVALPDTRFEVNSASQGQEGVLLVKRALEEGRPYAMAFIDVRMPPGWDGVETTRKIWELDPDLQVVLCTAYSDYSWGEMFEELGQRDGLLILKKPFDSVEAFQLAHALTEKWWLHQQARRKMEELESRVTERTQELARSLSLLNATLESTADAIVAVDLSGKIASYNAKFAATWQFPAGMLARQDAAATRAHTAGQVKDSVKFLELVKAVETKPEAEGFDVVELKDGRIFERYVFPQRIDGKCVGTVINWRDVTERQRAEAELQWKTAFLEAQVNSSIDGILVVDQEGKKALQNQRVANLFKIPRTITDGSNDADQVRWVTDQIKNPEQFIEKVRHLYAHPHEISRDEIELKDGTILDRYSAPVVGKDGKYYGRIWTFRDITERKRAEEALRESEERFSGAFEFAPIGVALVAPDGRWLMVNRALCELVGYSEAELLTRTFQDITHPEDLKTDLEYVRQMISGEIRSYQMEKRYVHARGHLVTVLLNVSLVRDSQGQPRYFISQIQDITSRKQAENAQRESNEKFHQLANNITDAFWIRSADMREVHYISPAFEQIWGRSVESLYANPHQWPDFILPEDRERVLGAFAKFAEDLPNLNLEYRIVRPGGEIRWVSLRASQVRDAAGKVIRLTGIVTDITERKRVEAQLFQSQKMETVGKLAGGIAHEFNSILTAIIGQSELILRDLPAGHRLAQSAAGIRQAAERAATLTRQLLAYSRKTFLRPESLDLNQVITGMEDTIRHLVGRTVDMRIVPAAGLHAVNVDAGQIEQVIVNLVMNAADAMPNGGKLTLETANVTFDAEGVNRYPELKPGNYALLAITDTGTGMSDKTKEHVFEPFFTTKDVGEGTGLGLSTCYGIIRQSGGQISVYSELGRGTAFKIYLPRVESQAKIPIQRLDAPDLPRGTETILLAEDDPALRVMAAALLRRLGYTVLTAANGIEALSLNHQRDTGPIDLLFTDVVMPQMSGTELSDRVRALYPHTRILYTSAYTEQAIMHQGVLNPGVALLQKPFTPSALALKVREVLDEPGPPKPDAAQKTFGLTKISNAAKPPGN